VPVSADFELTGPHYLRQDLTVADSGQKQPLRRAASLTFLIPAWHSEEAVAGEVASMARWSNAEAERVGNEVTLRPQRRWHNVQPIIARAASFGWRLQDDGG